MLSGGGSIVNVRLYAIGGIATKLHGSIFGTEPLYNFISRLEYRLHGYNLLQRNKDL